MFKFTPVKTAKPDPKDKRKFPVQPSLDHDTHNKLIKLAISCQLSKTKMAEVLIRMAVNNENVVNHYQDRFNVFDEHRIIPIQTDGKIDY